MKKKIIWTSDTHNWDRDEAKEMFFEARGYETDDDDELDEFIDEMNQEYLYDEQSNIEFYEKTHEQKYYVILAKLGLWDGVHDGGKVLKGLWNAIRACLEDYNTIYQDGKLLKVKAIHHDGTNYFEIRELTEKGVGYYERNKDWLDREHVNNRLFTDCHFSNHVKMFNELYGW